jgi:dihydrofolate synthase/folylpolyglutamate synthase
MEDKESLYVAGIDFTYSGSLSPPKAVLENYSFLDLCLDRVQTSLLGRWQVDNSALALSVARLFTPLDESRVRLALSNTRWEGRLEILREKPLLVVDGSHNPDAVKAVMAELDALFPGVEILFSGLKGKEWYSSLELIRTKRDSVYLVEVSHHRGESLRELERAARAIGFKDVKILNSPAEVWDIDEDILALGSLYLVGEIKAAGRFTVI